MEGKGWGGGEGTENIRWEESSAWKDKGLFDVGAYLYFWENILIFQLQIQSGLHSYLDCFPYEHSSLLETQAVNTLEPEDCLWAGSTWVPASVRLGFDHQTFPWIQETWAPRLIGWILVFVASQEWPPDVVSRFRVYAKVDVWGCGHWHMWPQGQPRERWQLVCILLHSDHTVVITSLAVPGGRQSKSQMTLEEWENRLTCFLPSCYYSLGTTWSSFGTQRGDVWTAAYMEAGEAGYRPNWGTWRILARGTFDSNLQQLKRGAEWVGEACLAVCGIVNLQCRACIMSTGTTESLWL
jgi:hypothetical protein